jgi:hypothetical protein
MELHEFYLRQIFQDDQTERMRWERHVAHVGEKRDAHGENCRKKPPGRPTRRWKDTINMDLKEEV